LSEQIKPQLRLRVFADPNGSGKSTVIKRIRETEINENVKLDVGVYINADNIAQNLKRGKFSFDPYEMDCKLADLIVFGETSGLLCGDFSAAQFSDPIKITERKLSLAVAESLDRVAQQIARFLRHDFIKAKRRFSFETVFSHESN